MLKEETLFVPMVGFKARWFHRGVPGLNMTGSFGEHRDERRLQFSISNYRTEERVRGRNTLKAASVEGAGLWGLRQPSPSLEL